MSKYTTEVRFICESNAGLLESTGYNSVDKVIASALPKIFDFDFPIFDEKYRSVLETKILKHYYTREIGEETVGLWKLRLNTRLNEVMPYYNKLYESELLSFNPLYDVDLTRDHKVTSNGTKADTGETTETTSGSNNMTGNSSGTGKTTGTTSGKETGTTGGTDKTTTSNSGTNTNTHLELSSDTPQGAIDNIEDGDYLTRIQKNTDNGSDSNNGTSDRETTGTSSVDRSGTNNSETESTSTYTDTSTNSSETTGTSTLNSVLTNTEDYLEHVSGKQGTASYSKMLQEYRQTFLNIDMSVIMELKDLFMNLW